MEATKVQKELQDYKDQREEAFTYMSVVKQQNETYKFELQACKNELALLQGQDLAVLVRSLKTENETLR